MKKIYTLMAVALVAMASTAQTRQQAVSTDLTRGEAQPKPLSSLAGKTKQPLGQAAATRKALTWSNAAVGKQLQRAAAASPIISEQPEGTLLHNWYGFKEGYYNFWYNPFQGTNDGDADDIVVAADGSVYLKNPVSFYPTDTWIKGVKAEGDTIAFEFPQKVYTEDYQGQTYDYCIYRMVKSDDDWAVDESTQTVKFVFRNDSLFKAEQESLMGLCSEDGSSWSCYGDYNVVVSKFEGQTVAPAHPEAARTFRMDYTDDYLTDGTKIVKVAIEGNDIFIGNFASNLPDAWVKGTLADGKAVFSGRTYLGVDTVERAHTWFVPLTATSATYGNGYEYYDLAETGKLEFTLVNGQDTLKTDGAFAASLGLCDIVAMDAYVRPELAYFKEVAGKPMKPVFKGYMAYGDNGDFGGVQFYLYPYTEDGNYLNPEKLFYRIYFDMEAVTFTPDEYVCLTEPMTDIPYGFDDGYDFRASGELHTVYFYRDIETFGVALFYKDGETEYPSNMVYLNLKALNGIEGVAADGIDNAAVSVKYTDLTGRTVSKPSHGLFIKTVTRQDGTVTSTKVAVK